LRTAAAETALKKAASEEDAAVRIAVGEAELQAVARDIEDALVSAHGT